MPQFPGELSKRVHPALLPLQTSCVPSLCPAMTSLILVLSTAFALVVPSSYLASNSPFFGFQEISECLPSPLPAHLWSTIMFLTTKLVTILLALRAAIVRFMVSLRWSLFSNLLLEWTGLLFSSHEVLSFRWIKNDFFRNHQTILPCAFLFLKIMVSKVQNFKGHRVWQNICFSAFTSSLRSAH